MKGRAGGAAFCRTHYCRFGTVSTRLDQLRPLAP